MFRRLLIVAAALCGCQPTAPTAGSVDGAPRSKPSPTASSSAPVAATRDLLGSPPVVEVAAGPVDLGTTPLRRPHNLAPPLRASQRCFPTDGPASSPRPYTSLTERTADLIENGRYADALVCAEEAGRVDGSLALSHSDRAVCLAELNRLDESEAAMMRALAIDPDDPSTLATAADLFATTYAPSADHSEIGLSLARRAQRQLKRRPKNKKKDKALLGWALVTEGLALTDLGRAREALLRLDLAVKEIPNDVNARYSRGVALYELSRFEDAERVLLDVTAQQPSDAFSWHYLGLVKERRGDAKGAEHAFAEAQRLSPSDFPPLLAVDAAAFRKLVDEAVAGLGKSERADLVRADLQTADVPAENDLTAEEPPLSPTILGLYRGLPLADYVDREPRVIVLYRKNLLRAVRTLEELKEQIRTTLLHELGHMRGEDDDALRSRGLE